MKKKELAERIAAIEKHLGIEPNKVELEVGKWYRFEGNKFLGKGVENKALFFNIDGFKDFGFDYNGKWYDMVEGEISDYVISDSRLATPEEVKSALVEEAKRRGYTPFHDFFYYDYSLGVLYDREGIGREVIFSNGKWAEIIEQPKPKEIVHTTARGIKSQIFKDEVLINCSCGCFSLYPNDIEAIQNAIEQLKGGKNGKD